MAPANITIGRKNAYDSYIFNLFDCLFIYSVSKFTILPMYKLIIRQSIK